VPANGELGYELVVPTLADSNGSGVKRRHVLRARRDCVAGRVLRLRARGRAFGRQSSARAARSVCGLYATGVTHLHWAPNEEPDLWYYTIHRGSSAGFVPGPSNLVGSPADTGFAASGPAGGYFKIAAVDVNGNVGGYALLTPSGDRERRR